VIVILIVVWFLVHASPHSEKTRLPQEYKGRKRWADVRGRNRIRSPESRGRLAETCSALTAAENQVCLMQNKNARRWESRTEKYNADNENAVTSHVRTTTSPTRLSCTNLSHKVVLKFSGTQAANVGGCVIARRSSMTLVLFPSFGSRHILWSLPIGSPFGLPPRSLHLSEDNRLGLVIQTLAHANTRQDGDAGRARSGYESLLNQKEAQVKSSEVAGCGST
jgi:hypothetical protein